MVRFGVVGRADEDDDRGQVHPEEQTDGGGEAAIDYVVGHLADVNAEEYVNHPPQNR